MRSRKRRKIGKRTFDETSSGGTNHHEINATIAAGKEKSLARNTTCSKNRVPIQLDASLML